MRIIRLRLEAFCDRVRGMTENTSSSFSPKILFITSTRIGDAILSNGILNDCLTKHPNAAVTIVCGPLVKSLYEGVPQAVEVIALKKQSYNRHWIALWKRVAGTKWDMVIDLRNSAVSWLIWARRKYIFGHKIDQSLHKCLQNAQVMKLLQAPDTKMWFSKAQEDFALKTIPPGAPVLGVGPTANWIGKTWPIENFIELVRRLTAPEDVFHNWRVAVFAAPGEERDAKALLAQIPPHLAINVVAKGNPGEAAAALARCDFYIGNDSGLMHAAAAAGIPTLGLFGASYPEIYAPYGRQAHYIRTPESFDELTNFPGYSPGTLDHSLMTSLNVEAVYQKTHSILRGHG